MKIALSGYGRMGLEIEKAALLRGHKIGIILNDPNDWIEHDEKIMACDVVIDFSWPESVLQNIRHCFDMDIPMVTGTTGWNDKMGGIREMCMDKNQALLAASNFSIGVNVLFHMNRKLAEIMNRFDAYTPYLEETHHVHKLDAPSGTALSLAQDLLDRMERMNAWSADQESGVDSLMIKSIREGEINGIHQLAYTSDADTISLRHEAKNRSGFAQGALIAAEWLIGKKGFFSMSDVLGF